MTAPAELLGDGRLFLLVREAAAVLEADERSVRRSIERGEIPAVRLGNVTRVPAAWLRQVALLDQDSSGPAPPDAGPPEDDHNQPQPDSQEVLR